MIWIGPFSLSHSSSSIPLSGRSSYITDILSTGTLRFNSNKHQSRWQLNCHWFLSILSTDLKAIFCSIEMIWEIATTATGRNVLTVMSGELLPSGVLVGKLL